MRALLRRLQVTGDDGSAVVEFLGAALILLVPVVYLVLVLGRLQSAAFAVDGAAREAARIFVAAPDVETAEVRAVAAVALALGDQGLPTADAAGALSIACSWDECLEPDGTVDATVRVDVALPGVPTFVQAVVPLSVLVTGHATAATDTYREQR